MSSATSDENGSAATEAAPHEPHIQILKGEPTVEEVAALVTVLGCVGGAPEPEQPEKTRWVFRSTGCASRCPTTSG